MAKKIFEPEEEIRKIRGLINQNKKEIKKLKDPKQKYLVPIVVGVVVGLLVIIFGYLIEELMSPPKIIRITENNEFCPSLLEFSSLEDTENLYFKYNNHGKNDGQLIVTVSSKYFVSKYFNSDQAFDKSSAKNWFFEMDSSTKYEFILRLNNNLVEDREFRVDDEEIHLDINAECRYDVHFIKGKSCGHRPITCVYSFTKEGQHYIFELMKEL